MTHEYTHITVILDRTGSMQSIRDDTIGGFNAFLKEQKALPGKATLTLVQFDSQDPYEVIHHMKPIRRVTQLSRRTFVPRASTPLLDAVGRGINDIERSIAALQEAERPGTVIVAIITDGQENASREFTREQIVKMVKEKTDTLHWQFVFLSAHLDAFAEAESMGIRRHGVMLFEKTARGTAASWSTLSACTTDFRSGRKQNIGFDASKNDEDSR